MITFVVLLLFGAFLGVIIYIGNRRAQARALAVAALAASNGFSFSPGDAFGIADRPFALFRTGHSRKAGLVVSGTHNSLPLELFDYEYVTGEGKSRTVHRNTCAIITIPAACPPLLLFHENALTRLVDHVDHHDVKLEYEDFNHDFLVKCEEQKFAFSLLDAQMMEWLLGSGPFDRVEIVGPWVFISRRQLKPSVWLDLGTWLDGFHSHIPAVVYSTFPLQ